MLTNWKSSYMSTCSAKGYYGENNKDKVLELTFFFYKNNKSYGISHNWENNRDK